MGMGECGVGMGMSLVWVVGTAGVTFSQVSIYLWTEGLERLHTVGARVP